MERSTLNGVGRHEESALIFVAEDGVLRDENSAAFAAQTMLEPAIGSKPDSIAGVRTVRGTRLIVGVAIIVVLTVVFNLVMAERNRSNFSERSVEVVLINDRSLTKQSWTPVPDGLVARFVSVDNNVTNVEQIRRLMKFRRTEYLRANYSDPQFGNSQIAGRADLEFGTANKKLNCRYRDVPGGGELRWITNDSVMLDSLKDWSEVVAAPAAG